MINNINKEAVQHNCFCLSQTYKNVSEKLSWACLNGHTWERNWDNTHNKQVWCSQCKFDETSKLIPKLKEIISKKGGIIFLPLEYNVSTTPILFMCKNNHLFSGFARETIKSDFYCDESFKMERLQIACQTTERKNGTCLSKYYVNLKQNLLWECYYNHQWKATYNNVVNHGRWCGKCKINIGEEITRKIFNILFNENFNQMRPEWLQNLELDGYCEKLNLAFEYNGRQHYLWVKYYHKTKEDFKKQKKRDVLKRKLCEENDIILLSIPYWIKYDELKEYIVDQCKKLEINIPNNVNIDIKEFKDIYQYKNSRYETMREIVEAKGGKLLTDVYIGCSNKFNVDCGKGHIWRTSSGELKSGCWCPKCNSKKYNIKKLRKFAISKGGKCLSQIRRMGPNTKLEWKCNKNHIWEDTAENVLNDNWCDKCDQ